MDAPQAEVPYVIGTLTRMIRHERQRLATGLALRQYISQQLEAGNEVDHYRLDWLQKSMSRVIDTLAECARDFDREHLSDRASAHDLCDVLASALSAIHTQAGDGD
jgi:hypothetical protein